jgi:hypothetical protein
MPLPPSPYPPTSKVRWVVSLVGLISVSLLAWTICLALGAWRSGTVETIYILAVLWAVLPPIWFWFEYFFLYQRYGEKDGFEAFKYGQQISVAIWAAVTLSLAALASSEHFKGKGDTYPCHMSGRSPSATGPKSSATDRPP